MWGVRLWEEELKEVISASAHAEDLRIMRAPKQAIPTGDGNHLFYCIGVYYYLLCYGCREYPSPSVPRHRLGSEIGGCLAPRHFPMR